MSQTLTAGRWRSSSIWVSRLSLAMIVAIFGPCLIVSASHARPSESADVGEFTHRLSVTSGSEWLELRESFNETSEAEKKAILLLLRQSQELEAQATVKILAIRSDKPEFAARVEDSIGESLTNLRSTVMGVDLVGLQMFYALQEEGMPGNILAIEIALKRTDLSRALRLQAVGFLDDDKVAGLILLRMLKEEPKWPGEQVLRKLAAVYRSTVDAEIVRALERQYDVALANTESIQNHQSHLVLHALRQCESKEAFDCLVRIREAERGRFTTEGRSPWADVDADQIQFQLIRERRRLVHVKRLHEQLGPAVRSEEDIASLEASVSELSRRFDDRMHWLAIERCIDWLDDRLEWAENDGVAN